MPNNCTENLPHLAEIVPIHFTRALYTIIVVIVRSCCKTMARHGLAVGHMA